MVRLFWVFYKSLIAVNIAFSIGLSLIITLFLVASSPDEVTIHSFRTFYQTVAIVYLTGGFLLSIGFHELYKNKLYSFYRNRSATRIHLFISAALFNTIIGLTILLITSYA